MGFESKVSRHGQNAQQATHGGDLRRTAALSPGCLYTVPVTGCKDSCLRVLIRSAYAPPMIQRCSSPLWLAGHEH
eukprot:scaffold267659_cov35-Tisochrysis_lutea.AAC.4